MLILCGLIVTSCASHGPRLRVSAASLPVVGKGVPYGTTVDLDAREAQRLVAMFEGLRNSRHYMPLDDCDGVFGMQADSVSFTQPDGTVIGVSISTDWEIWEDCWNDQVGHGRLDSQLKAYIQKLRDTKPNKMPGHVP